MNTVYEKRRCDHHHHDSRDQNQCAGDGKPCPHWRSGPAERNRCARVGRWLCCHGRREQEAARRTEGSSHSCRDYQTAQGGIIVIAFFLGLLVGGSIGAVIMAIFAGGARGG